MKRVALAAAITLATFMAAALLWRFRGAAGLFLLSLAVAATVRPSVDALEPRLGRVLALMLVYVAGLALLGTFLYLVTRGFLRELDLAVERLGAAYDHLRAGPRSHDSLYGFLLRRLPPAADLYRAIGAARPSILLDEALGLTRNVIDLVGQFLILVALSAYWNARRESFERLWLSLLPASSRPRSRDVWRGIEHAVGSHLRSELVQSALCVVGLAAVFQLTRLSTPLLPALAAGVLRLVPFFGIPFAAGVAFLAGFPTGPMTGAFAAGVTLAAITVIDRLVARRLLHARRPSPVLTVVFVVALVEAYGVLGLLLASTLSMALQVYVERLIVTHPRRTREPQSLDRVAARLERVRKRLLLLPEPEAAQLGNVVARLGALTAEAHRLTGATAVAPR